MVILDGNDNEDDENNDKNYILTPISVTKRQAEHLTAGAP